MLKKQTVCKRCVMDTSIPEIIFDKNGECQFCKIHDELESEYPLNNGDALAKKVVKKIKEARTGDYDCVVGVSGGRDSTWLLYTAVKLGLKPLAVHYDNGWNSDIASKNIHKMVTKLNIDLETVVADWNEFKDLQMSFLKASVPDVEVPTDLAIHSVLHHVAAKENIRYILNGHSFRTEGVAPKGWTYFDGRYIKAIQKIFGRKKLTDFKNFGIFELFYYSFWKRIKVIPILNYFPYNQKKIDKLIKNELEWVYSGGHHHESTYTKFIQSYLLPSKFGIDKRKTELSALIRSNQIERDTALHITTNTKYEFDKTLIKFVRKKFDLSEDEWLNIYNLPVKSFLDYPSYYPLMKKLRFFIKLATKMNLLPKLLYLKYLYEK